MSLLVNGLFIRTSQRKRYLYTVCIQLAENAAHFLTGSLNKVKINMPVADGLYCLESGKENHLFPPVVLIHGAGGTSLSWPAEIRRLHGYRIISIDLPGHGRSEGTGLQSVQAYADRVIGFLETLKINRAVIVGHSMGGAVAMMIAVRRSKMVFGLGLVSTGAFFGGGTEILDQLSTPFGFSRGLQIIQEKSFGKNTPPQMVKTVMQTMSKTRHGLLFSDWQACADFDLRAEIPALDLPVWVAVGAEDQITPQACSQFLVDHISNSSLQIIPEAGHMVLHEAGQEVALGLRAFLERIDFREKLKEYKDTYFPSEPKGKNINFFSML